MEPELTLPLADSRANLATVGGKGASLARLAQANLPVPAGFYITTAAYRLFVQQNDLQPGILTDLAGVDLNDPLAVETAARAIQQRLIAAPVPQPIAAAVSSAYAELAADGPVAVRSSATAEDLPEASFAGQQDTYLNITGQSAVLAAVQRCWASLWTARAIAYRARQGIAPDQVALAVVIQCLVEAGSAGILFTANPLNGQRGQMMINAAWGLGEAVVGGLVTPDTYMIDKATGQVTAQEIADKQVMTVRTAGGTHEQPVPAELRRQPSLNPAALNRLTQLGLQIEALYGTPMDIEWAVAGDQVAILQARPITALPDEPGLPVEPSTVDWTLPNPKHRYMRGSIADFMPTPLTPLFESMVVSGMNTALFERMQKISRAPLAMYTHFFTTINHFAYNSASFSARDWLQMIVHIIPATPRLIRDGLSYWRDDALPRYTAAAARWQAKDLQRLKPTDLLHGIEDVFSAAAYHLATCQVSTLGIAAGAEGIYTAVYNKFIRQANDPPAAILLLGFDSTPIEAEKSLFDLAQLSLRDDTLAGYLRQAATGEISTHLKTRTAPEAVDLPAWADWAAHFQVHLDRFGYAIYNLDFGQPLPEDDPVPMLETIRLFMNGQGKNPYERQQAAADRREAATAAILQRVRGLKAGAFRKTLGWAQRYGPLREDSIAELGLGYPIIRAMAHELGQRMVQAGWLGQPAEIYWLEWQELQSAAAALEGNAPWPDHQARIRTRQAEHQRLKNIIPPHQLPDRMKLLGVNMDALMGVHEGNDMGNIIHGLGASAGQITATARVLAGPEDFKQMHPGDVLVAAITTPAWTPLFAMASAVVTDIGGPLSHGSIVAREYGIPAVLGTGVATRRIKSGQRVTVDGTHGTVTLLEEA